AVRATCMQPIRGRLALAPVRTEVVWHAMAKLSRMSWPKPLSCPLAVAACGSPIRTALTLPTFSPAESSTVIPSCTSVMGPSVPAGFVIVASWVVAPRTAPGGAVYPFHPAATVPGSPPQQPLGPATDAGMRGGTAPAFGAAKRSARLDRRTRRDLVDLSAMARPPLCHQPFPGRDRQG